MEYMEIGKIVNTRGLKGELRIIPSTDDITRFGLLDSVIAVNKGKSETLTIEKVWYYKQFVIIKFKEISDINQAEKYKGYDVKIPKELALPLEENEYYVGDLTGMEVVTADGENLGVIDDVLFTGANDVYVIKDGEKELLLPAIRQCILSVDTENRRMTVNLLEGLR